MLSQRPNQESSKLTSRENCAKQLNPTVDIKRRTIHRNSITCTRRKERNCTAQQNSPQMKATTKRPGPSNPARLSFMVDRLNVLKVTVSLSLPNGFNVLNHFLNGVLWHRGPAVRPLIHGLVASLVPFGNINWRSIQPGWRSTRRTDTHWW